MKGDTIGGRIIHREEVGYIMRALGGGGHVGAGFAVVKGMAQDDLKDKIVALIQKASKEDVLAKSIMSDPLRFKADTDLTMAQAEKLLSQKNEIALLVCEGDTFLGTLSAPDFEKAERSNRLNTSVKVYIKRQIPVIGPTQNIRQALDIMNRSSEGLLPVVEGKQLVGVLTRGDILLQIYDI